MNDADLIYAEGEHAICMDSAHRSLIVSKALWLILRNTDDCQGKTEEKKKEKKKDDLIFQ